MTSVVIPVLFAVFVWWFSTGLVLYAVNRPAERYGAGLAVATAALVAGLIGLYVSSGSATASAAYAGFLSALAVWGWHEMTFLMGLVTGPCTVACTRLPSGRAPLVEAVATVIYHEAAIALTAGLIAALTWGGENLTGLWTFVVLWVLRLSAKINVYLGVPNLTEEFLPPHLQYLKSYFCHRPMNMFFPFSVTAATVAMLMLGLAAADAGADEATTVSYSLLAAFMGLALIEHWFLVIPFRSAQLWTWGLAEDQPANATATPIERAGMPSAAALGSP